jgi:hypothetical protein
METSRRLAIGNRDMEVRRSPGPARAYRNSIAGKEQVMSKKVWSNILSSSVRAVLAFVFVFGQTVQGQSVNGKAGSSGDVKSGQGTANLPAATEVKVRSATEKNATAENSPAEKHPQPGTQQEGITVHGHWIIEIRQASGAIVTHREFENSIAGGSGDKLLAQLLSRQLSQGLWLITLVGSPQVCASPAVGVVCWIAEPGLLSTTSQPLVPSYEFETLKVSLSGNTLVLSGIATAYQSGAIIQVGTNNFPCVPTFSVAAPCTVASNNTLEGEVPFTAATLSAPISVSAGQTIAVTVSISFS